MKNIEQGNDARQNCQKPNSVLTEVDKKGDNITVYLREDNKSGVYYKGKVKGYFNGAVRDDTKPDHFIGDDSGITSIEEETPEINKEEESAEPKVKTEAVKNKKK